MVRVTDLKQYAYCPRIIYYTYCLPHIRPETFLMEEGREASYTEEVRQLRRSLHPYGLRSGICHLDVSLISQHLRLSGRVDLVIETCDNAQGMRELIPVEFKLSPGRMGDHLRLQLAGYALLLEELWDVPVRRGYVYFIPLRRATLVSIDSLLQEEVQIALHRMQDIVDHERMPPPLPTRQRARCEICEFRLFCNDV